MRNSDFERPVTVVVTGQDGTEVRCSALLERDPAHLSWNRMSLIGDLDKEREALILDGLVTWRVSLDPRYGEDADRSTTTGGAFVSATGGTSRQADENAQAFAWLDLHAHTERTVGPHWTRHEARFWFLQRPAQWPARPRRPKASGPLDTRSDWIPARTYGLKVRLTSDAHIRKDRRLSPEAELIRIPGVEMRPTSAMSDEAFTAAADALWFSLRVLITFATRQYVWTAAEFRQSPGAYAETMRTVAVEPLPPPPTPFDSVLTGPLPVLFTQGAAALRRHAAHRELLHAAAVGYALSHQAANLEAAITGSMEAIERLVGVAETIANLPREIVSARDWKPVARDLKRALDAAALTSEARARVKRAYSSPPSLTLEERIRRIAKRQDRWWSPSDRRLLVDLSDLIKVRNDIVHGRMVKDLGHLYVQRVRAHALFETLFLNLLGVRGVRRSGEWDMTLVTMARRGEGEAASDA
jgi:hypothetical protein